MLFLLLFEILILTRLNVPMIMFGWLMIMVHIHTISMHMIIILLTTRHFQILLTFGKTLII